MKVYATRADYDIRYVGDTITDLELANATVVVNNVLWGVWFDMEDTDTAEALRDATLTQAHVVKATRAKVNSQQVTPDMLKAASIGGTSYTFRDDLIVGAVEGRIVGGVSLEAVQILRAAGLLNPKPFIYG